MEFFESGLSIRVTEEFHALVGTGREARYKFDFDTQARLRDLNVDNYFVALSQVVHFLESQGYRLAHSEESWKQRTLANLAGYGPRVGVDQVLQAGGRIRAHALDYLPRGEVQLLGIPVSRVTYSNVESPLPLGVDLKLEKPQHPIHVIIRGSLNQERDTSWSPSSGSHYIVSVKFSSGLGVLSLRSQEYIFLPLMQGVYKTLPESRGEVAHLEEKVA